MTQNYEHNALTEGVYYILLSLHTPLHGYGIMQFVKEISEDRVVLSPGTLYGAINTMVERNWIQAVPPSEERKKEYVITELGKRVVQQELIRLQELVENGKKITGG